MSQENTKFLTAEQVKQLAPSVFQTEAHERLSDKYVHVQTHDSLGFMENLGWGPVDAIEVKSRKADRQGFQKHLVIYEPLDDSIKFTGMDNLIPRVLELNAHDGRSSYAYMFGILNIICRNGLIAIDDMFSAIRFVHKNLDLAAVEKQIETYVNNIPHLVDRINTYSEIQMTEVQKNHFAMDALKIKTKKTTELPADLLTVPRRKEDEGDSLWKVFNVVQENIIQGGVKYKTQKKNTTTKRINGIRKNVRFNKELWALMVAWAAKLSKK